MLSKTSEGGLVYGHKFNESYFFNLSNLHIVLVIYIFHTKKMVGVGRRKGDCWVKSDGYLLLLHENSLPVFDSFCGMSSEN